ncbi:uncharacterized protein [Rutidosis leptorrhynchoides]|uniref:uncharacterized protein n=1 Tax=Rutidosis leptorrhynchoides TaxID=125765 RepID=UPI003A991AF4
MDLCAVQIKPATRCPYIISKNKSSSVVYDNQIYGKLNFSSSKSTELNSTVCHRRSFVVRAIRKKNSNNNSDSSSNAGKGDHSVPEGEGYKGNFPSEKKKSSGSGTPKPQHKPTDWREFRAILYLNQQLMLNKQDEGVIQESKRLGSKWAHPLTSPETGCVLVATEKLDGVQTFERSVVFLLGSGTRHPQEGPFGVIINRPLHKRIKNMKPTNLHLATTFSDCLLHFGGPLEASIFLLQSGGKKHFEEVVPSLCFGSRNCLDEASALVKTGVFKPQDFKFFVGYAGWQLDQLNEEIEAGLWHVAACSSNLIFSGTQNENLWEEILQLMGGTYSELSRKPKQDFEL